MQTHLTFRSFSEHYILQKKLRNLSVFLGPEFFFSLQRCSNLLSILRAKAVAVTPISSALLHALALNSPVNDLLVGIF